MSSATPEFLFVRPGDMSQLKKKIAKILRKRMKIIGLVKLSTVLEELEIQIHGPCFKLPILTMERSL